MAPHFLMAMTQNFWICRQNRTKTCSEDVFSSLDSTMSSLSSMGQILQERERNAELCSWCLMSGTWHQDWLRQWLWQTSLTLYVLILLLENRTWRETREGAFRVGFEWWVCNDFVTTLQSHGCFGMSSILRNKKDLYFGPCCNICIGTPIKNL